MPLAYATGTPNINPLDSGPTITTVIQSPEGLKLAIDGINEKLKGVDYVSFHISRH